MPPDTDTSSGAVENTEAGYLDQVDHNAGKEVQDDNADSSPAEDAKDEGPKSVLEAIADVMETKADKDDGDPSNADEADAEDLAAKGSDEEQVEEEPADKAEPKPEGDDKPPPFHDHPRWKALLKERDELREQMQGTREDVEVTRGLREFAAQTGLNDTEISDGLRIMALMKENPQAALEALQPHLEGLRSVTGEAIPEDIQTAIDEGDITPELAKELAKARGATGMAQAKVERSQQALAAQQSSDIGNAVQRWTDDWQKTDADASVKLPRVMDRVKIAIAEGFTPKTSQEAINMVQGVIADVTKEIEALRPKRPARKPMTAGGRAPSQAQAEPKSMLEVVQLAAG